MRKFQLALFVLLAGVLLTGCVTPPPSFKLRPEGPARIAALQRVAIVQPDIEVSEISAGGVAEKRDDWSAQVATTLSRALANKTRYRLVESTVLLPNDELTEIQALIRTLTVNHISYLFAPSGMSTQHRPLTYNVGAINAIADAAAADGVLFVFARDAYSSAGRKALVALGFATPAPAIASAVLVERDGTVQWFNYHFAQNVDMRTDQGAATLAQGLLEGLPRR